MSSHVQATLLSLEEQVRLRQKSNSSGTLLDVVASYPLLLVNKRPDVWSTAPVLPAALGAISALALLATVVYRRISRSRNVSKPSSSSAPIEEYAAESIASPRTTSATVLEISRLVACIALLALSFTALIRVRLDHLPGRDIELAQCFFYAYASVLFLSATVLNAKSIASRKLVLAHAITLLLLDFAVYAYRDLWPLATYYLEPTDAALGWITWVRIALLGYAAVVVPLIMPREYVPVDPKNPMPPSPNQTASILSLMLYSYMDPLIRTAAKHPHLPFDELPPLADVDHSAHLRDVAFPILDPTLRKSERHIFFGLLRVFAGLWFSIIASTIFNCLVGFIPAIALYQILHYVETGGEGASLRPWFWVVVLLCKHIIGSISDHWYLNELTQIGVRAEGVITQLVFAHALRIRVKEEPDSPSSKPSSTPGSASTTRPTTPASDDDAAAAESAASTATLNAPSTKDKEAESRASSSLIGKINNLISSDLDNIIEGRELFYLIFYAPLKVGLSIWFLYVVLGWSSFVGCALLLVGFYIPGKTAAWTHTAQKERMKKTDERVQTVTETINLLRVVKMFGWEHQMEERLEERRTAELHWLRKYYLYTLINTNVTWILPLIALIGTYATFTVIMKQPIDAATVNPLFYEEYNRIFSSLGVLESLREAMFFILQYVPSIVTAKVSLDRVDDFLRSTELLDEFSSSEKTELAVVPPDHLPKSEEDLAKIGFKNAHFIWSATSSTGGAATPSRREFKLRVDGEVTFQRGVLNLVVGPTASGKTSTLLALLGELHYSPALGLSEESWFNLPRDGGVSFAAQEPWILNESIKENILFGTPYDEARYKQVLYECALERDLELFTAGDATEVGERGLTLSGGQKARISLARAVYSQTSIVLLDDVLAALDVHTIKWVVRNCLSGKLLRGRTVVLVSHNIAVVGKLAKRIISLSSGGVASVAASTGDDTLADPAELAAEAEEEKPAEEKEKEEIDDQIDDSKPVEARPADQAAAGKLILEEEVALGHVSVDTMLLYARTIGGAWFWGIFVPAIGCCDLMDLFQTWWLGYWARQYDTHPTGEVSVAFYLGMYSLVSVVSSILYTIAQITWLQGTLNAARIFHQRLAQRILGTTLRVLDKTPVGRIIQRFTKDMGSVDVNLSRRSQNVIQLTLIVIGRLVIVIAFAPVFLVPSVVLLVAGVVIAQLYIHAQLPVKREMSNSRGPVFSVFGAAINGLTTIRAYGVQDRFLNESLKRIDKYTRTARPFWMLNRWVGLRVDYLGGIFAAVLTAYSIYTTKFNASEIGFLLNMTLLNTELLLHWIRCLNDVEVEGNSLERIQQYLEIEQEKPSTVDGQPPAAWPTSGELVIDGLSARYSADSPVVLHDLRFTVRSGEKVGIVGRTGSGKSSLTLSLLRLIPTEGEVVFDGQPTSTMNLQALRGAITIIPQQPELMSGSVRENLDPFGENDDAVLNAALRSAGLFSLQEDLKEEERVSLDTTVGSSGGNFSLGQRQILALARALVRQSKVLILDEATASMDHKTDTLIQESLRTQFKESTVITIAHRLHTIMDADKVLVLDAGQLIEYDSPKNLLERSSGTFKSMVDGSGDVDALYALASATR